MPSEENTKQRGNSNKIMSYEIVKSIKIKDNEVFITGASNNVYPRTPSEWESGSLSKILRERGRDELDMELLEAYESGNFQGGSNKYTRALKVLTHMPEYKNFDWRGNWKESHENRKTRKDELQELMRKALNTRLPKEKFIVTKMADGKKVFLSHREKASFCKWYYDIAKAKIFDYREDAEDTKKWFTNSNDWKVEIYQ